MILNNSTYIIIVIIVPLILYFIYDYYGPSKVYLRQDIVFGMSCTRAKHLIVQEYDNNGNLWATRGMIIYKLINGDNKFVRVAQVPTGLSVLWLYNFTIVRKLSLRPECMEIVIDKTENICAFSAGSLWYRLNDSQKFRKSMKLSHYGHGIGRGMLSNGIFGVNNITFFGEYFDNSEKTNVRIYKSLNKGKTWEVAYEFAAGQTRHIHALMSDPYSGRVWVCTGDKDNESMIGWSDNYFQIVNLVVQGNQVGRSVVLVFTEHAVYWGTDTGIANLAGIYRWDKKSNELLKLTKLNASMFYGTRLAKGTIVMSSEVEGSRLEIDEKTRLFIINDTEKISTLVCGTWNIKKKGYRFSPARLRFQRNQGSNSLAITCLNQKEISNGDLIIISEDVLTSSLNE